MGMYWGVPSRTLCQEVDAWMNAYRHIGDQRFDKLARHVARKKPKKE